MARRRHLFNFRAVGAIIVLVFAALKLPAGTTAATLPPIIVSPAAATTTASTTTQISLLGLAADSVRSISVSGSVSGHHRENGQRYRSLPGESFISTSSFAAGETVTVAIGVPVVGALQVTYSFTVARHRETTPIGACAI
jgi:hypothetical protein